MRAAALGSFALPDSAKRALFVRPGDYRGYIPFVAKTDRYQGFKLHRGVAADDPIRAACDLYGPNRRPGGMPGFRRAVRDYWRAMDALGGELLRIFALAPGCRTATSWARHDHGGHRLICCR